LKKYISDIIVNNKTKLKATEIHIYFLITYNIKGVIKRCKSKDK